MLRAAAAAAAADGVLKRARRDATLASRDAAVACRDAAAHDMRAGASTLVEIAAMCKEKRQEKVGAPCVARARARAVRHVATSPAPRGHQPRQMRAANCPRPGRRRAGRSGQKAAKAPRYARTRARACVCVRARVCVGGGSTPRARARARQPSGVRAHPRPHARVPARAVREEEARRGGRAGRARGSGAGRAAPPLRTRARSLRSDSRASRSSASASCGAPTIEGGWRGGGARGALRQRGPRRLPCTTPRAGCAAPGARHRAPGARAPGAGVATARPHTRTAPPAARRPRTSARAGGRNR